MEKEYQDYIPDIRLVRELELKFNGDLNTRAFDAESDFETYLCALAYASAGKELFYDSRFSYHIDETMKVDDVFMQGMLTYSILQKIAKAKSIIDSSEFQKSMSINFEKEDQENDYATIAFIMYYLTTKGYRVQWNKMSHAFTPINLENGPVYFAKDQVLKPDVLMGYVEQDLNQGKVV